MNFDANQRATTERAADGNMRGIATTSYEHPPDARNIVARIEGVPSATYNKNASDQPANSIGSKGWRDANVARISSAITRRSVHAATERSGWTSIVTTNTSTLLECLAANLDEAAHYCSSLILIMLVAAMIIVVIVILMPAMIPMMVVTLLLTLLLLGMVIAIIRIVGETVTSKHS